MLSNVKYRKTLAHIQLSKYGKLQRESLNCRVVNKNQIEFVLATLR